MRQIKKYLTPKNYVKYAPWFFNSNILHHLDILLAPKVEEPLVHPPVFIIGPPRSGTTLLFQIITDAFDLAYLSNTHCRFFGAPALAERLFRPLKKKSPSDYTSLHGRTNGPDSPSECGEWWYRFFRRDPAYVTLKNVDESRMKVLRRSLTAFAMATGKPLFFKNLYAALRLEPLSKFVPEALYIVMTREEYYNAASILAGRKQALNSYQKWWSVPPPGVERLVKLTPCQQVVGQIRSIYAEIDRIVAAGLIERKRVLRLPYEDMCNDTQDMLNKVDVFLKRNGLSVGRRFEVPKKFRIRKEVNIPPAMQAELRRAVEMESV